MALEGRPWMGGNWCAHRVESANAARPLQHAGGETNRVAKDVLSGKVCLITGGAKRVGAAIARRLHGAGANLMLHYHSAKAESVELQQALNAARANSAATVQANLLNAAELPELVRTTVTRFGRLDVLINNASTF